MNGFRYRMADWISGGKMTMLSCRLNGVADTRLDAALERSELMDVRQKLRAAEIELKFAISETANGWHNSDRYASALRAIAAEVKPTSNATVRRMGRMAEEALK